ncbi:helix-turn-helix transcriptional regulator [Marinactinospora endophytica]
MPHGPAVGRRRLGIELRKLRRAAGLTGEEAGERIEVSGSKISRLENGKGSLKKLELKALLEVYGVTDQAVIDRLHTMARVASEASWWDEYSDVLPSGLDTYVGLEAEAAALHSYTNHLVHGLLQTPEYARASLKAQRPRDRSDTIERLVELRIRRQQIFKRAAPFKLWAITEETVLRRPVGGSAAMAAQLDHILRMTDSGRLTLQILPLSKGAHAGSAGPFTIIEFPETGDRDVVYIDSPAGNVYLQSPKDVADYRERFGLLMGSALDQDESISLAQKIRKELQA